MACEKPTVVIELHSPGMAIKKIHITEGVDVIYVDDDKPGDRLYCATPNATVEQIRAVLGNDSIGHANDSCHQIHAHRINAFLNKKPALSLVGNENNDQTTDRNTVETERMAHAMLDIMCHRQSLDMVFGSDLRTRGFSPAQINNYYASAYARTLDILREYSEFYESGGEGGAE